MIWTDIWTGIKLHFFDVAASSIVGLIVGFALGFSLALFDLEKGLGNLQYEYIFIPFGLAVSVYTAIMLRRQYTSSIGALVALAGAGIVLEVLVQSPESPFTLIQSALLTAASIIAYVLGWYVAGEYQFVLPMPGPRLRTVVMWIGGVLVFLSLAMIVYGHFH